MSVRVSKPTKTALDIVAAELELETGRNYSIDQTIWVLIERSAKHVADRIEELLENSKADDGSKSSN